jgi:hypothetical protein
MKKTLISAALAAAGMIAAMPSANAALATDALLNFDPGVTGGYYGFVTGGSYFTMDSNGDGIFKASERTAMSQNVGLAIGTAQGASGSHSGAPDGSETPGIDNPWNFFSNTGMHGTSSAVNILSDDGVGNVTLDFSGWYVTWNGIPVIDMGAGAFGGVANVTCGIDCSLGDTYTLAYEAAVPAGDPSGFGGVAYQLNLVGTIGQQSAVPVPAALWLFGSGLLGLAGVARRRKTA